MAESHGNNSSQEQSDEKKETEHQISLEEILDSNSSPKDIEKQPSVKRRLKSIAFGRYKRVPKDPAKKKRKGTWALKLGCHMRPRTMSNSSESSSRCGSCICTSYKRTEDSVTSGNDSSNDDTTTAATASNTEMECLTLPRCSQSASREIEDQPTITALQHLPMINAADLTPRDYHSADLRHNQELNREIWLNQTASFSLISTEFQLSELTLTFHRRVNLSVIPYLERMNGGESFSTVVSRVCEKAVESMQTLPTVHTRVDYVHCLVPDLLEIANCSFYWGKMDRYEAEKLLENKPEGTFLLRDSAQEEYLFSVSFRRYDRTLHARIEQWNHKFSFDPLDPGVFAASTVCGLIEHYKDPSCCMFFEPMLTIPLHRTFPFSLQHLSRAVICSCVTYDGINRLVLPKSMRMYLKEYHYKQKVRVRCLDSDH